MRATTRVPLLCLVTDRRQAYAGSDRSGAFDCLVGQARWAADADIDLLQVRENDLEGAALADLVDRIVEAVRGSRTRVVVNDRLDVALALDAAGVHLRVSSPPASHVRSVSPDGFLVGASVHSVAQAQDRAGGVDYLIAGTVYATPSKPGQTELLGSSGLTAIVSSVACPVLAIGGITVERAADVARAGAAGIAAIGIFIASDRPGLCRVGPLIDVTGRLRGAFVR